MTHLHQELRSLLEKEAIPPSEFDIAHYLGSSQNFLHLSTPTKEKIVRHFVDSHSTTPLRDWEILLADLAKSPIHEERISLGSILARHTELRISIHPSLIDIWLDTLSGWNQVDCLCQNVFQSEQILDQWSRWQPFLRTLSHSPNINKRRAALVLLTKPVEKSPDPRLKDIAFATIILLMPEREILITKAISWLLRSLSRQYAAEVTAFIDLHESQLPKIAVREARKKILTGKKNG